MAKKTAMTAASTTMTESSNDERKPNQGRFEFRINDNKASSPMVSSLMKLVSHLKCPMCDEVCFIRWCGSLFVVRCGFGIRHSAFVDVFWSNQSFSIRRFGCGHGVARVGKNRPECGSFITYWYYDATACTVRVFGKIFQLFSKLSLSLSLSYCFFHFCLFDHQYLHLQFLFFTSLPPTRRSFMNRQL